MFLAGDDAYKIKRAVRFPYMDFSTLERRRVVIEREFEINRRNAPEIYVRVVPITRDQNAALHIGGTGTVVEWALQMRRFEQSALMSSLADRGGLTREICQSLTSVVFESHQAAPQVTMVEGRSRMNHILEEVSDALTTSQALLKPLNAAAFGELARAALSRAGACLDRRAQAGHVRRCHGDLHLNNIVLWNGKPTLFDAIEFDEKIATVDTLYDLAFLLMDLDRHGLRPEANIVFNRYLWRSETMLDLEGLVALPLFMGLRSGIRTMVGAQQVALDSDEASETTGASARAYLAHALRYLQPPPAQLIAIGGFSGTGKSTLAAALAPQVDPAPGALHIRSDIERKVMLGTAETTRLTADSYSRDVSTKVYGRVLEKTRLALAAGHSVVVDAVFASSTMQSTVERIAADLGKSFTGLWLTAPRQTLLDRVAARTGDASDATPAVVERQLAQGPGAINWIAIDAGGSREDTERLARAILASRGREPATP